MKKITAPTMLAYKGIHAHPELSHHEERTAGLLAAELRKSGYTVTERVGKYPDGTQAYGVVAILENGRGPRLLIRADMAAIVTIGSIHGGTKRNIIPNEVKMEITARAHSDKARQIIVDGIRRTAQGVALSAGVPEDLAPIVTVLDAESTPVMYNDPKLTARVKAALVRALGAQNVIDEEPGTASEDFGILGLEGRKIPTMMFGLGAIDPGKFAAAAAEGKLVPGPHNSRFEPAPEPTLRTGVTAMSAVAIDLLR